MIILISGKLVKIKPSVIPNLKSNCWLPVFCPYSVYRQTRYNAKIWLDRWWRFNEVILYSYVVHMGKYMFFINWTLRMSDNLPERVQMLCHAHIICITVLENRMICCQLFCDLLLKSAFERIFNVMQLILVKMKWHIKWKYLIKKFNDICLSYYFKSFK